VIFTFTTSRASADQLRQFIGEDERPHRVYALADYTSKKNPVPTVFLVIKAMPGQLGAFDELGRMMTDLEKAGIVKRMLAVADLFERAT